MRCALLISNKEERFLVRSVVREPEKIFFAQTFDELLAPLRLNVEKFSAVIIDERLELRFSPLTAVQQAAKPTPSALEVIEELRSLGAIAPQTLLAVIMAEGRDVAQSLIYSEVGADLVLARPIGSQDLKTHFENFFKMLDHPPASLTLRHNLRFLVEEKKFDEAIEKIRKFLEMDGKNLSMRILLARALVSQDKPELIKEGIASLKELDSEYKQSVLTKSLLRFGHERLGLLPEASVYALTLFRTETNSVNLGLLFDTLRRFLERVDRKIARPVIGKVLRAASDVFIEKNRLGFRFLIVDFLQKISELMPEAEGAEIFAREIPRIYVQNDRDFYQFKKDILKVLAPHIRACMDEKGSLKNFEHLEMLSKSAVYECCKHLLEIDLNQDDIVSIFAQTALEVGKGEEVWNQMGPVIAGILAGKKTGLACVAGLSRVALELGLLKEASDMIHQGRRQYPGNETLDSLAERWKELFNLKQS